MPCRACASFFNTAGEAYSLVIARTSLRSSDKGLPASSSPVLAFSVNLCDLLGNKVGQGTDHTLHSEIEALPQVVFRTDQHAFSSIEDGISVTGFTAGIPLPPERKEREAAEREEGLHCSPLLLAPRAEHDHE